MTTIALPRPRPRNALLDRLRTIQIGVGARGAVGVGLATQRGGAADFPDWWSVAGKTCAVAYQPKGAANLAASYVNLANPGTYDAAPGVAPNLSASGWGFTGTQYLVSSVRPEQTFSTLVRFSNYVTVLGFLIGNYATPAWGFYLFFGSQRYWVNGNEKAITGVAISDGVIAMAGVKSYWNGTATGIADNSGFSGPVTVAGIGIGATQTGAYKLVADIQAIAIYLNTLTAGEVATVSAAMAAL